MSAEVGLLGRVKPAGPAAAAATACLGVPALLGKASPAEPRSHTALAVVVALGEWEVRVVDLPTEPVGQASSAVFQVHHRLTHPAVALADMSATLAKLVLSLVQAESTQEAGLLEAVAATERPTEAAAAAAAVNTRTAAVMMAELVDQAS